MSRSRHLRRILGVTVVATVSLTWGAGAAFATDDADIDQSNNLHVDQLGNSMCQAPTALQEPYPEECETSGAFGNSGGNSQYAGGQANVTGQADLGLASGSSHDAFAIGALLAIAVGGDAFGGAANYASSDNNLESEGGGPITNTMTTGDAMGANIVDVDGVGQSNDNDGSVLTIGVGSGASVISQDNFAVVLQDGNTALANSGANVQATGGQLNLTGQLALAGAQGSPALGLSLGLGVAIGGDAVAFAINKSTHGGDFSNYQNIENTMTTGNATAVNSTQVGQPFIEGEGDTPDTAEQVFVQSNWNDGNSYAAQASLGFVGFTGAFIGQHNTLIVDPSGNTAIANSGANLQASGSQLNGTLQVAGSAAGGGWAGSIGTIALAFAGDATAGAVNLSHSANHQTVSNDLTTGDATAQNYTGVLAEQKNENHGNAGALQGLAFIGISVGGIVQSNYAAVNSYGNDALANTGANGQIAGFQGNGTLQGAGALAGSGWAGTLGGLAISVAGDAVAGAINHAYSENDSHVTNTMVTGDASASNLQAVDLTQSNTNTGWAAGVSVLDVVGVGVAGVIQHNGFQSNTSGNTALANSGANVQGTLGQGNLTLQGALAGSWGSPAIALGVLAGAAGGDASAWAKNGAESINGQKVHNDLETGDATARNVTQIDLSQSNDNSGDGHHDGDVLGGAILVGAGVGAGVIYQGNSAEAYHDFNFAAANTGANAQFSGPQINITGQLALAGAEGGGALSLALLGAGAVGGDAHALAGNRAESTNWQLVCNDLLTGVALAVNGISVTATQANNNLGDAAGVVLAADADLYAGVIVQENNLAVGQLGNVAVANSGLNSQASGPQVNATVQISAAEGEAGASGAGAIIGSVAIDGDAGGGAWNSAISENSTEVHNSMETGDATAINQVVVDVEQQNDNEGDSLAVGVGQGNSIG